MPRLLSIFVIAMLLTSGCARNVDGTWKAPLVYRIDVQQGNVVDQEMLNKLRPGMDKKQVKFIMGTPLITDTFHSDRWDYLYSFEPGRGEREQRRITLFFENEKLDRVEGNLKITDKPRLEEGTKTEHPVAVPLEEDKPGFFKRLFSRNKKNAVETRKDDHAPTTETPAAAPAPGADAGAGATDTPDPATGAPPEQVPDEPARKPETPPEAATTANARDTSGEQSTESSAGNTREKNLLRRFWDRMTKSDMESDTVKDEESEQNRRDAEVLESTSGDVNQ